MSGRHRLLPLLWSGVILLCLLGVFAAVIRVVFISDFARRSEPLRQWVFDALGRRDPLLSVRREEGELFDSRYAAHRVMTWLHVIPGGAFLAFAPLQFSSRLRRRYLPLHRWLGRSLVALGLIAGCAAMYFGLLMPFAGIGEVMVIVPFAALFFVALIRAFVAIRKRQVAVHREWMIRAFAVAVGISSARVVSMALDLWLAPHGVGPRQIFVLSLWLGWTLTVGVAELWIRRTRLHAEITPPPMPIESVAIS